MRSQKSHTQLSNETATLRVLTSQDCFKDKQDNPGEVLCIETDTGKCSLQGSNLARRTSKMILPTVGMGLRHGLLRDKVE